MAGGGFPTGIIKATSNVDSNVPDIAKTPTPSGPLPIPYPNIAHFETLPALQVYQAVFDIGDIVVIGVAPLSTDFHGF